MTREFTFSFYVFFLKFLLCLHLLVRTCNPDQRKETITLVGVLHPSHQVKFQVHQGPHGHDLQEVASGNTEKMMRLRAHCFKQNDKMLCYVENIESHFEKYLQVWDC